MRNNSLLLVISVQKQPIRVKAPRIGITGIDRGMAFVNQSFSIRIPAEHIQHGVIESSGRFRHLKRNIGQVCDSERGCHGDIVEVRDESPQPVKSPIGPKRSVLVGEGNEGLLIKRDPELGVKFAHERRIEREGAEQLKLDIVASAVHRDGPDEHRRAKRAVAVRPFNDSHCEVNRINPSRRRKFDILVADLNSTVAGAVKGNIVPDKVPQKSRRARKESCKATRVPCAEFDSRFARQIQKRVLPAQLSKLLTPHLPHGRCNVCDASVIRPRHQASRVQCVCWVGRSGAECLVRPAVTRRVTHGLTLSRTSTKHR